jgi:hypothetical protein
MAAMKTVFRVRLRLASFGAQEMKWEKLVVDRPSAEDANELIKWAYRLDSANNLQRPPEHACKVERLKISADGPPLQPLDSICASLEAHFTLHRS